jgi:hypothetical protein
MGNATVISKTFGHIGAMLCTFGVLAFFIGIFGGPRTLAFVGLAMMVASLAGFFIEENASRR